MLGEELGEFQGKVTGQRILPADDVHPQSRDLVRDQRHPPRHRGHDDGHVLVNCQGG